MLFYGWELSKMNDFKHISTHKLKMFLIISALMFAVQAFSQDNIRIENGLNYKSSLIKPFIQELYQKNDFVVLFRTVVFDRTDSGTSYFVLTGKGKQLNAFSYSKDKLQLIDLNLSSSQLDLIWRTIQQNELFKIRDEKDIPNFCAKKYDIYGSYTYEFTILSQGYMKVLSYYNPEYYIEACYGISERQNIINSAAIINRIISGN